MNCPICQQKLAFGLQMHMAAVHGARAAEFQGRAKNMGKDNALNSKPRPRGKPRRGKGASKGQLKHPRLSKLS